MGCRLKKAETSPRNPRVPKADLLQIGSVETKHHARFFGGRCSCVWSVIKDWNLG